MRVTITCEKCGVFKTVMVTGRWDLSNVTHTCDTDENLPVHPPYEKGPIHVLFRPPRRPF